MVPLKKFCSIFCCEPINGRPFLNLLVVRGYARSSSTLSGPIPSRKRGSTNHKRLAFHESIPTGRRSNVTGECLASRDYSLTESSNDPSGYGDDTLSSLFRQCSEQACP